MALLLLNNLQHLLRRQRRRIVVARKYGAHLEKIFPGYNFCCLAQCPIEMDSWLESLLSSNRAGATLLDSKKLKRRHGSPTNPCLSFFESYSHQFVLIRVNSRLASILFT